MTTDFSGLLTERDFYRDEMDKAHALIDRLRAENADLRARLKAVREQFGVMLNFTAMSGVVAALARATDLRRRNWRRA